MEEELEQLWQKLQLTEEEEVGVKVTKKVFLEGSLWAPHCLLASLLTRKSFNKEAFKGTMEKVWKANQLKKIAEVGENLFIFQFGSDEDREIIINSGPWNFDDRMVLTKSLEKEDKPRKELLTKAQIWTQIYGLPFVAMTEKMGRLIGMKLGRVIEVKTDEEGLGLGACLAVRIEIDVRKQLMRRMRIVVEEDQTFFVYFKYERLPAICYCCGIIGHNESDCALSLKKRKEGVTIPAQFGKWIRAPSRQKGFKDRGGGEGRKGGATQFGAKEEMGMSSLWKKGDDGAEAADVAEIGEGKMVIANSDTIERERLGKSHENREQSGKAHGEPKGTLSQASPTRHAKEEDVMVMGKGAWQRLEEERKSEFTKAGEGENSNMCLGLGRNEDLGPFARSEQFGEKGMGLDQLSARGEFSISNCSSPKLTIQSSWKRKNREDEVMKENQDTGKSDKLGKRRTKEVVLERVGAEESGKRRKVVSETSNKFQAEAVFQPRHDQ